jgi:hypothetical protein
MRGPASPPAAPIWRVASIPFERWHPHVHQDDVRPVLRGQANGVGAVGCSRDDGDVGLRLEQRREPGANDLVVVGHERPAAVGSRSRWSTASGSSTTRRPARSTRARRG